MTFLVILGVGLLIYDWRQSSLELEGTRYRNGYGAGSKTESFNVSAEGSNKKIPVEIHVSEQRYTEQEAEKMFDRLIRRLDTLILGENKSLDKVEKNLNLVTEVEKEPVTIRWELDDYQWINVRGELSAKEKPARGAVVNLRAVLTYTENEEFQAIYERAVCIYPEEKTDAEKQSDEIKEAVLNAEEEDQTKPVWKLPAALGGIRLHYYQRFNYRGIVVIVMTVMVSVLLWLRQKENQKQNNTVQKEQMLLDYPEIINKLTLFIGAGMTVKRAWKKIVQDYEMQKETRGIRYAYEEMKLTCREIESGISETESYEKFGKRCEVQAYLKLGALLSQNLRKGVKGLSEMLRQESTQAFEDRKARAKRKGEEAGTKLLLPMFLMLTIVLMIVIVPAFLSVQI